MCLLSNQPKEYFHYQNSYKVLRWYGGKWVTPFQLTEVVLNEPYFSQLGVSAAATLENHVKVREGNHSCTSFREAERIKDYVEFLSDCKCIVVKVKIWGWGYRGLDNDIVTTHIKYINLTEL